MQRAQRGFTLIELMTVITIVALLSLFMFSISSKTYGARPDQVADNVAAQLNLAKLRAISSRRIQRVTVVPTGLHLEQATTTGFSATPAGLSYALVKSSGVATGAVIWDVATATCGSSPCSGAPTAADATLEQEIYFQPDGSSTGGTIYITDPQGDRRSRVSLYRATGGTLVRDTW